MTLPACPHCQGTLNAEVVAEVQRQSLVGFRICPAPGELLDARTVGGSIEQMGKVLRHCGTEVGLPSIVLVQSIVTDDSGNVDVRFLVCRGEPATARAKRLRARKATP